RIRPTLDKENSSERAIGTARSDIARSRIRLVQIARTDQARALRRPIRGAHRGGGVELALQVEIPVLQVAAGDIRAECIRRGRGSDATSGRKWIIQRQKRSSRREERPHTEVGWIEVQR